MTDFTRLTALISIFRMSIPVESSPVPDQTTCSLSPTQILSTLNMPEFELWAQPQEERLQQVVEESGPPVPLTSGFFTQIA